MRTRTISPRLVVVAMILLATGVGGLLAGSGSARGVGYTDARVQFAVTDAATAAPLPGALIHIHTNTPESVADPENPQFTLTTNETGRAEYHFDQMRFSSATGWFKNSFSLALPYWEIRVTCPHYHPQEDVRLISPETVRQMKPNMRYRVITIPVRLHRAANDSTPTAPH